MCLNCNAPYDRIYIYIYRYICIRMHYNIRYRTIVLIIVSDICRYDVHIQLLITRYYFMIHIKKYMFAIIAKTHEKQSLYYRYMPINWCDKSEIQLWLSILHYHFYPIIIYNLEHTFIFSTLLRQRRY